MSKCEYFVGPDPVSDIRDRAWDDYTLDLSPAQGERLVYLCELANKAGREGKEFPQEARQEIATTRCAACPTCMRPIRSLSPRRTGTALQSTNSPPGRTRFRGARGHDRTPVRVGRC